MGGDDSVCRNFAGRRFGKGFLGRPRMRWMDEAWGEIVVIVGGTRTGS
jgi:hypothetical protein